MQSPLSMLRAPIASQKRGQQLQDEFASALRQFSRRRKPNTRIRTEIGRKFGYIGYPDKI